MSGILVRCAECEKVFESAKHCSQCKTIYCSKECQVTAWPTHGLSCGYDTMSIFSYSRRDLVKKIIENLSIEPFPRDEFLCLTFNSLDDLLCQSVIPKLKRYTDSRGPL